VNGFPFRFLQIYPSIFGIVPVANGFFRKLTVTFAPYFGTEHVPHDRSIPNNWKRCKGKKVISKEKLAFFPKKARKKSQMAKSHAKISKMGKTN